MIAPNRKVGLLALGLVVAAALFLLPVIGEETPRAVGADWWHFAVAFFVVERAAGHVEMRRHATTLSLSEAVLLLGLVYLSPVSLLAARLVGAGVAMAVRRQPIHKLRFNLALFACEVGLAALLVHTIGTRGSEGLMWATAFSAVLLTVAVAVACVSLVISSFDKQRPIGLLGSVMRAQFAAAIASLSLAVLGAIALEGSWSNAAYLVMLVAAMMVLIVKQAVTEQRAGNLESVGRFAAALVGLSTTAEVVEALLRESAQTMRGTRSAIVVGGQAAGPIDVYVLDTDRIQQEEHEFVGRLHGVERPRLLSELDLDDTYPDGIAAPLRVRDQQACLVVWDRSTEVGHFAEADLALFGSLVGQAQTALDRSALIDQLHYDAHHDSLTRLPNRLGFSDGATVGPDDPGTLFVLDLDRFKDVNDTLGHPTGDRALEIIADRLRRVVGDEALLARLGGDEFAVFDPRGADLEAAAALAAELTEAVEQPIAFEDLSLQLGVSIGIALAPTHGDDLTVLMKNADAAMYRSKRRQLGWQFYSREDDNNDPRRLELVSSLRRAIAERELEVYYQPTINIADGSLTGAEALSRWTHPRYGAIPASDFIALAESAGLMRDLTEAVLERVVDDVGRWEREGNPLRVAVNLSPRNLLDDTLPDRVADMLELGGVAPDRISFEITETSIMVDRDRVMALLERFNVLGIELAIDDFGTGYSSLAYLRELPVDALKIDRSFVTNVDLDAHNEVIVRSTINLAHSLGLKVYAEGIEREGELAVLESLGCDFGQGYLFSRPLPAESLERWRETSGRATSVPEIGPPPATNGHARTDYQPS